MERAIGLGCMRLSTDPERDERRAVEVIHAALDAGVTLLDTADAYCLDAGEVGHNERLVAAALASWSGPRAGLRVATKGGLTRPDGRWVPDGRAAHLRRACEASLDALGVDRIDLYQLHAPDPRTPLATSVRALRRLQAEGMVEKVGLCNVTLGQLEEARSIVEIAAVQVAISPFEEESLRNGVVEHCIAHGIELIAHSPFGGHARSRRLQRDEVLAAAARRHDATPHEAALAWLLDLDAAIVPIPGATRVETARSGARAAALAWTDEDRRALDARFPAGALLRTPRSARRPAETADREVVLVMGMPASGKSTQAEAFVERGYRRLNRDREGGRLADLLPLLERGIEAGASRFVLDNTYASRRSRNEVIELAWAHGIGVRCIWVRTPLRDALRNAAERLVARFGALPSPEQLRASDDPQAFGPRVLYRHDRELEPPRIDEGFTAVEVVDFERAPQRDHVGRACFVDYSLLWSATPRRPDEVELLPGRAEALRRCVEGGARLLAMSWVPEVGDGKMDAATLGECFAAANSALGVDIEPAYCPHGAGPPVCWCRKPLPGLAVAFVREHGLDPRACVLVGKSAADRQLAECMGFAFTPAEEFFAP